MLIKHVGSKINFIDENDTFVGFDYTTSCCENYGYLFTYNRNTDFQNDVEIENEGKFDLDGYIFDKEWYNDKGNDEVVFRLIRKKSKNIYLIIYNSHNGYYAHGFEFKAGDITLLDGYI